VWRRRYYVLVAFLLISLGVTLYSLRLQNVYLSEARILAQSDPIPKDFARPADSAAPEDQLASLREYVQGRTFLESMIQELQMFGYPNANFSMDNAVRAIRNNIKILSTSRNTCLLSFSASDPHSAQNFTIRLLEKLKNDYNSSRRTKAVEADQFLDSQLQDADAKLRVQEERLKQFKLAHLGELPEQSTANINALSGLQAQLAMVENALQQARDQLKLLDFRSQEQKRLGILTRNLVPPTPGSSAAGSMPQGSSQLDKLLAAKQAELSALKTKYMPAHPDVQRVTREVEELKNQITAANSAKEAEKAPELTPLEPSAANNENPAADDTVSGDFDNSELKLEAESINNEIKKRENERENLLGQIKMYQKRLNLAPALEQELMSITRDHEIIRLQYTNLQTKKFQSQMTYNMETDRKNETFRVIDEPNLPERPAFPTKNQIMFLGICGAFVAGIAAAFGREMLDSTLGSEQEAIAVLNLPVLAMVSEVPKKGPRRLRAKTPGLLKKSA
jgi:polysaccharide chain length determinant protein (PEP-CTERM system associated)